MSETVTKKRRTVDDEGRVSVANSYYSAKKMGYVRVYLDGKLVVELEGNIWGLRAQMRRFPTSMYRREFKRLCESSCLSESQVRDVFQWVDDK